MTEDPCYDSSELAAAAGGRLPLSQAEKILQHADSCPRCEQILIDLESQSSDSDAFVDAVNEMQSTEAFSSPQQNTVPERIDEYLVERRLGEGGLGVVFLARHQMLSNRCVIKVIQTHHVHRTDIQQRFLREMKVLSGLEHPHIVRTFSAGWWREQPYLVMEFLEGEDLEVRVRRDGPLPVETACRVIAEAAAALHYAHGRGITHRDIKPSNLFATQQGDTKVIDFGLARIVDAGEEDGPARLTREGTIAGTPEYMSPEQFRSTNVTAASDTYSLGVTLVYLLTGRLPATGSMMEMMQHHSERRPINLPAEMKRVPARISALATKMLHREAAQRPEMQEIAVALQTFVDTEHSDSQVAAPATPVAEPNRRRLIMFSSLVLVASVALCAVSGWPLQLLSENPTSDAVAPADAVAPVDAVDETEPEHPSVGIATRAVSGFELNDTLKKAVKDSIRERNDARELVDDASGNLYSIRVTPLPPGGNGRRLWPAILSREKTKATARLLKVDSIRKAAQKEGLTDTSGLDEAIEFAAADPKFVGTVKNLSSHQRTIEGSATTLVYAPQKQVDATLQSEIAVARLREAYRDAIHRQSRRLMQQKRWAESLELWRHLHKLQLTSPALYLDTAKCFLALKQPADATGLLKQTLQTHATVEDWRFFEEVGELLISIDSPEAQTAAARAFDLAGEKYTVQKK